MVSLVWKPLLVLYAKFQSTKSQNDIICGFSASELWETTNVSDVQNASIRKVPSNFVVKEKIMVSYWNALLLFILTNFHSTISQMV